MTDKRTVFSRAMFGVYLAVLSWIILFKLRLPWTKLVDMRALNLIPFAAPPDAPRMNVREPLENLLLFVPLGAYLDLFRKRNRPIRTVLDGALLSLLYEVLQYLFRLGASDITDLIMNTAGTLCGVILFRLFAKLFGMTRAEKVMDVLGAVLGALFIGLVLFLHLTNP